MIQHIPNWLKTQTPEAFTMRTNDHIHKRLKNLICLKREINKVQIWSAVFDGVLCLNNHAHGSTVKHVCKTLKKIYTWGKLWHTTVLYKHVRGISIVTVCYDYNNHFHNVLSECKRETWKIGKVNFKALLDIWSEALLRWVVFMISYLFWSIIRMSYFLDVL